MRINSSGSLTRLTTVDKQLQVTPVKKSSPGDAVQPVQPVDPIPKLELPLGSPYLMWMRELSHVDAYDITEENSLLNVNIEDPDKGASVVFKEMRFGENESLAIKLELEKNPGSAVVAFHRAYDNTVQGTGPAANAARTLAQMQDKMSGDLEFDELQLNEPLDLTLTKGSSICIVHEGAVNFIVRNNGAIQYADDAKDKPDGRNITLHKLVVAE